MIEYDFFDARGRLSDIEKRMVIDCLRAGEDVCNRLLPLSRDMTCLIRVVSRENSKITPVEGRAVQNHVTIILDTAYPVYRFSEQHHLITSVFGHEWHHIIRDLGRGYGKTKAQAIASEGLALAFEVQVTGMVPCIARAVAAKKILALENTIKSKLNSRSSELHSKIFVGGQGTGFPRWFGYSLAYAVVHDWLERQGMTASEAVNVSANRIIRPWQEGRYPIRESSLVKADFL